MPAAALWALLSVLLFTTANALVKLIGPALPSAEVSLFRAAGGLLLIVLAWRELRDMRRLADPKWHLIRGVLGSITIVTLMHAFATLPMALVTTIYYARVLLMIPLAALVLGERPGRSLYMAAVIGLIGGALTLKPAFDLGYPLVSIAALLLATVASSGSQIAVTRLTRTNPPGVIVSVFALVAIATFSVPSASVWVTPAPSDVAILAVLGVAGALAQYTVARAYSLAGASRVAPISYIEIPLAAAIGWFMARELPTSLQIIGTLIVVAATAYVSYARRPGGPSVAITDPAPERALQLQDTSANAPAPHTSADRASRHPVRTEAGVAGHD